MGDTALRIVTKKSHESMTDKEKAEWIGISDSDINGSVQRFKEKMEQIGVQFGSKPEMTEAFMDVWKGMEKSSNYSFDNLAKREIR